MKTGKYILAFLAFAALATTGCKNDDDIWGNKLYISSTILNNDLLISREFPTATRTIEVRTSQPVDGDVEVKFAARPDMTAAYNMIYGDNARMLPAGCYEFSTLTSKIRKGAVAGDPIVVKFSGTADLNKDDRYVLPVSIADAGGATVLESARTAYFVFKGGALINVVADIRKVKFPIKWSTKAQPMVTDMTAFTLEALVRSPKWDEGRGMGLGTLFGAEGEFLIRIGDGDRKPNQIQFTGNLAGNGSFPAPGVTPQLPINEWVHLAVVMNSTTGARILYIDGIEVCRDSKGRTTAWTLPSWTSWTGSNAERISIGYAYEDERYFPGDISEMRIWNVERTAKQIADNALYLNVEGDSQGLVAYWKFNDGTGGTIVDHSGNGTNLTSEKSAFGDNAKSQPVWVPVSKYTIKD